MGNDEDRVRRREELFTTGFDEDAIAGVEDRTTGVDETATAGVDDRDRGDGMTSTEEEEDRRVEEGLITGVDTALEDVGAAEEVETGQGLSVNRFAMY